MRYRFLFEQVVRRELRQRYQGSALGVLWYLVNPLVLMGAYTLMFSVVLKAFPRIGDYPLFLLVGIMVWTFFSQSLLSAAPSLINQSSLVRAVRFPRQTIPAGVVAVQLITFIAIFALLGPIAVAIRGTLTPELLLLVPILALLWAFVTGLALIVAIAHAYLRDVAPILAALLVPWFFLTPIFFRVGDLPGLAQHRWVETLLQWVNPIAPFIEAVRTLLYNGRLPSAGTLIYVTVAAVAAALGGLVVFRRFEPELAVVV